MGKLFVGAMKPARSLLSLCACLILAAMPSMSFATVITAFPQDFTVKEGTTFNGASNGPVAIFADDNPSATAADFNASIDWGDGSALTAGTIVVNDAQFSVLGTHTYADEGSFTVTVTINDNAPGTGTATVTDTATVTEADSLSGTPVTFSAIAGTSVTATVATFSDTLTTNVAGDFTATIDWGDATVTAGTVSGGGGAFAVSGTHTYAATGTFSVTVTLSDDAPGTATATVTSTAHVGTTVLTVTPINISAIEHTAFNGSVASFTDSDTTKTSASFNASINWGDGTTSLGTITGGSGSFSVTGQHTYTDEGSFPLSITVTENPPGTSTASASSTATVTDADSLSGTPVVFTVTKGSLFSGTVARFSDSDTANVAGDFTATIGWGDGTTTPGTVSGSAGAFAVSGTHTYAISGNLPVTVTLSDDAPGTATARVISTAIVNNILIATAVGVSATEQTAFNGKVASFTDSDTTRKAASFTASINWGDGATTSGTIAGSNGSFTVTGQHTYADEGSFPLSVTVAENAPSTVTSTATASATVNEADVLSGTPVVFSATAGSSFNGAVANFTDSDTVSVAGDFVATINWGDGTTTPGTVSGSTGAFQVAGTHTYTSAGSFSVVVTLNDDAPGTATASVTSTANVTSTLAVTAKNISPTEHTAFNGAVATFTDSDISKTPASFTASINWGDGTNTPGTITGGSGSFTVTGQHTYADEGSFPLSVTVAENAPGTASFTATATATAKEGDVLSGTLVVFTTTQGRSFNGTVAQFTDTDTVSTAGDFSATINWGDGTTTAGIVSGGGGTFQVNGTHTYANYGTFPVVVTLSDDAPGTATASVTSTGNVASNSPAVAAPLLGRYGMVLLAFLLAVVGLRLVWSPSAPPK